MVNKSLSTICISFTLLICFTKTTHSQEISLPQANGQQVIYGVQKGDDLWTIALSYYGNGNKWFQIAEANNLLNPRLIHSGNKLVIPSLSASENLLSNGDFESNNFGQINDWSATDIELNKWYLVSQESYDGIKRVEWVNFVDFGIENPGHGLLSTDTLNCDTYCSSEAVQIVVAKEKTAYTLSANTHFLEGTSGSLYLDFLGSSKNRIDVKTTGGNSQDNWAPTQINGTSPAGTKYIRVLLYTSNQSTGKLLWDNIKLQKTN